MEKLSKKMERVLAEIKKDVRPISSQNYSETTLDALASRGILKRVSFEFLPMRHHANGDPCFRINYRDVRFELVN